MVVLGCDVSTTTIGYAFVENQKILDIGFIDISKKKTIREKAMFAFEELQDMKYFEEIDKICVEDSLSSFAWGKTSTQTIIKLAKFNAVFCFVMEWGFENGVESINPNTARKIVFGRSRQKGKTSKEFVRDQLEKRYNVKDFIKLNTRGNFDKRNIDAYDATVCALYYNKTCSTQD